MKDISHLTCTAQAENLPCDCTPKNTFFWKNNFKDFHLWLLGWQCWLWLMDIPCPLGPGSCNFVIWDLRLLTHKDVNFFLCRGLNSKQNFLLSFCWLYPSKITDFVHSIIHLIFTYSSFKANASSSKKRAVNKLRAVSVTQKYSSGKTCECVLTGTEKRSLASHPNITVLAEEILDLICSSLSKTWYWW